MCSLVLLKDTGCENLSRTMFAASTLTYAWREISERNRRPRMRPRQSPSALEKRVTIEECKLNAHDGWS